MSRKNFRIGVAFIASLLIAPQGLRAQEDAEPAEKPVEQTKPFIEIGAPFRDDAVQHPDAHARTCLWMRKASPFHPACLGRSGS